MKKENKKVKRKQYAGFRLRKKFANAFRGLKTSLKEESTLIYYFILTLLAIAIGIWISITLVEWAILLLTFGVLYGIEFLNTAIENFVDLLSFEYNIQAKKIKDVCAAASVLNSFISLCIGVLIFAPGIITKFNEIFMR